MISNELLKYTILKDFIHGGFVKTNSKFEIFKLENVVDIIPTKHFQIKQSEIKKDGKYPVVSQSQSLIEGYSNDCNKVFYHDSSCVIFGDHSKTIKYIDFPFIVGADGTKVLQPKSMLNGKYLYYHLIYNVTQIKSSGYTRNFKYLKQIKLFIPPLEEQEKIVKKIEELFELIDKKEKNDQEKEKLKTLLKEKILDSAIRGQLVENDLSLPTINVEEAKDNIPFEIPNNWKWSNLKNNCEKLYAGGDKPLKFSKEKTSEFSIPVIANGVNNDGIIGYTDIPTEIDNCLTISGRGTIGYASIRDYPFTPIVRLITIKPKDYLNVSYLKYVMEFETEVSKGTSIPQLTIPMIKNKLIPIPPLEQQKKIVDKIEKCFELIEHL